MNDAKFYFANLGADVARCIKAAEAGDEKRYEDSLERARKTLAHLRTANRPEAYEEGLLLLSGLEYARKDGTLASFQSNVNALSAAFSPLTASSCWVVCARRVSSWPAAWRTRSTTRFPASWA